jgi:hypothetical protein
VSGRGVDYMSGKSISGIYTDSNKQLSRLTGLLLNHKLSPKKIVEEMRWESPPSRLMQCKP